MDKTLQDLTWSVLPKEFKEEVKKLYGRFLFTREGYYDELFGKHNLTSDAEGEEMLYAKAKTVREMYAANDRLIAEFIGSEIAKDAAIINNMLRRLFGSKCLPDKPNLSEILTGSEPKPAESKFKVGDIAVVRGFNHPLLKQDGAIVTILSYHDKGDFYSCAIAPNVGIDIDAKYLEPYTEPQPATERSNLNKESSTCTDDCSCQDHFVVNNEMVDRILKDGLRNERRLNIAAMAMQGILANPNPQMVNMDVNKVADLAILMSETLIAEAERGGKYGED